MEDNENWDDPDGWDDNDFDYEAFVEDNFSDNLTNHETKPLWRGVAVVMLLVFLLYAFLSLS